MTIENYLKEKKILMDGAMGTYYSKLKMDEQAISELANIKNPDIIKQIHKEYLEAGANLLRTNTFAANTAILPITLEEQRNMIKAAYGLAVAAVNELEKEAYVVADIGPIPENSSTSEEDVLFEYKNICDAFLECGAKIFLFETFSDLRYIKELVKYINERTNAFIIANFCLNKNGYTKAGISGNRLMKMVSEIDEINACGFNCGVGSGHLRKLLKNIQFPRNKYIVAVPNAGYPEQLQNRMVFMDNAGYFGANMKAIADLGVDIIGGCCGTTPTYINAISQQVDLNKKEPSVLSEQNINTEYIENKSLNEFVHKMEMGKKIVAVELDPPFDANIDNIMECAHLLKNKVDVLTFADSPMGRSRVDSILMSTKISAEVGINVMPHVCCRDKNMISMRSSILGAYIHGIRNLLVVTGDPVPSDCRNSTTSVFDYNSIQLMNYLKEMNMEHFVEEPLVYGGALNYGRGNLDKIIQRMNKKIEAGASYFLTQPIFSDEDIERIRYIKEKVNTKVLCGIMPLVSYRNAMFIKNEITGIHVPDEIVNCYAPDMSKEEAQLVGAIVANEIIEKLSDFADGYYFMLPFNRVSLMDQIIIK